MVREVLFYINIQENLRSLMQKSPFKMDHFMKSLQMGGTTFYRKLKKKSFNEREVLTIAKILNPQEVALLEIEKAVNVKKKEITEGKALDGKNVFTEIHEDLEEGYLQAMRGEGDSYEKVVGRIRNKLEINA